MDLNYKDPKLCKRFRILEAIACLVCLCLAIVLLSKIYVSVWVQLPIIIASIMFAIISIYDLICYSMNTPIHCKSSWILYAACGMIMFFTAAGVLLAQILFFSTLIIIFTLTFALITAIIFFFDLFMILRNLERTNKDILPRARTPKPEKKVAQSTHRTSVSRSVQICPVCDPPEEKIRPTCPVCKKPCQKQPEDCLKGLQARKSQDRDSRRDSIECGRKITVQPATQRHVSTDSERSTSTTPRAKPKIFGEPRVFGEPRESKQEEICAQRGPRVMSPTNRTRGSSQKSDKSSISEQSKKRDSPTPKMIDKDVQHSSIKDTKKTISRPIALPPKQKTQKSTDTDINVQPEMHDQHFETNYPEPIEEPKTVERIISPTKKIQKEIPDKDHVAQDEQRKNVEYEAKLDQSLPDLEKTPTNERESSVDKGSQGTFDPALDMPLDQTQFTDDERELNSEQVSERYSVNNETPEPETSSIQTCYRCNMRAPLDDLICAHCKQTIIKQYLQEERAKRLNSPVPPNYSSADEEMYLSDYSPGGSQKRNGLDPGTPKKERTTSPKAMELQTSPLFQIITPKSSPRNKRKKPKETVMNQYYSKVPQYKSIVTQLQSDQGSARSEPYAKNKICLCRETQLQYCNIHKNKNYKSTPASASAKKIPTDKQLEAGSSSSKKPA